MPRPGCPESPKRLFATSPGVWTQCAINMRNKFVSKKESDEKLKVETMGLLTVVTTPESNAHEEATKEAHEEAPKLTQFDLPESQAPSFQIVSTSPDGDVHLSGDAARTIKVLPECYPAANYTHTLTFIDADGTPLDAYVLVDGEWHPA